MPTPIVYTSTFNWTAVEAANDYEYRLVAADGVTQLIQGYTTQLSTPAGPLLDGRDTGPYFFQVRSRDIQANAGPWTTLEVDYVPPDGPSTITVT